MNTKFNISETKELMNQGLTDKEIASILGCTSNQFANHRKRTLKMDPNNPNSSYHLTKEELEIIIGTLLGDSTIRYVHNKCLYPSLSFSHCEKQKEWAEWKSNKLSNLKASFNGYVKKSGFNNYPTLTYQFTGKNLKCLCPIHEIFYQNRKKVIPIQFLSEHMSELSIYCLMMDDGYYDPHTNSFGLCTNCFELDDIKEFCKLLNEKFSLEFTIKKDKSIYLKHKSNKIMFEILKKYNECESMNYKCCSH